MKIFIDGKNIDQYIEKIAEQLNLEIVFHRPNLSHLLYNNMGLSYISTTFKNKASIHIDFLNGKLGWRLKRFQHESNLKKAIGKSAEQLTIFDATAGQLNDSMIFLSLGHKVVAVEQSKILYTLVRDAIRRVGNSVEILKNLTFIHGDSLEIFKKDKNKFDIVYLDPMYPTLKKSVKRSGSLECIKEILTFEQLMSNDDNLIQRFLNQKYQKIIVKRPLKSPEKYSNINYQIKGKTIRYDIFL